MIEKILADKKSVRPAPSIRFGPGRGELEIHYSALSFRAPEKNQFRYRLEGVDPDWVEAGNRRVAYYNSLPPGRFHFQVVACNNDLVWNVTGAAIDFVLSPHYWQTSWFLGLAGLMVVGTAVGTTRYVIWRKTQQKLARLQQQHALDKERSRIARDIHDDLGARLVDVVLIGEQIMREDKPAVDLKTQFRAVARKVEHAIRVIDQIVWAVNPENDSLPNLADYLSDYAQDLLQSTETRCRLDIAAGLPEVTLQAQARHNLFLAVKEALNNIVKHAKAAEIGLRIQCVADELLIEVEDNGQGFNLAEAERNGGNGLRNMRQRLSNLGARAEILSRPGLGTTVRLVVPLNRAVLMSTHYGQDGGTR
jgi:signal transduction histidine kinase